MRGSPRFSTPSRVMHRTRPTLLCNSVAPHRSHRTEGHRCLRQLASLDTVGLHACSGAHLTAGLIRPPHGEAKPSAVTDKAVIVHHDAHVRLLLPTLGDLSGVSFGGDNPIPGLFVSDVLRRDAIRNEFVSALMPDALPAVEQVAQLGFVCHALPS